MQDVRELSGALRVSHGSAVDDDAAGFDQRDQA